MMTTNRPRTLSASTSGFVALVVDNDPASRLHLRALVESDGGQVMEAGHSAGETLERSVDQAHHTAQANHQAATDRDVLNRQIVASLKR